MTMAGVSMVVPVTVQLLAGMVLDTPGPLTTQDVCTLVTFETVSLVAVPDFTRAGAAVMVPVFVPEQAPPMVSGWVHEPPAPSHLRV